MKRYFVYIMASKSGVTYTGMTNDLIRRVAEHKQKAIRGFTAKYNIVKLVYYEDTHDVRAAIAREKQIKALRRQKKVDLIEQSNPKWVDLTTE
ncbi:MAG: GIY-YIG nuclease family protein [bacterium]